MNRNLRLLSLSALLALPSSALAGGELDLVDVDLDDTYEDFMTVDGDEDRSRSQKLDDDESDADHLLGSFDEDPEWDMPDEADELLGDEDPSWDVEPEIGAVFDDPFADEDDFVIPQTAPEPVIEEIVEEEPVVAPETEEAGIKNANPGLDLSIFDIDED